MTDPTTGTANARRHDLSSQLSLRRPPGRPKGGAPIVFPARMHVRRAAARTSGLNFL
jgi:hypothetical protein